MKEIYYTIMLIIIITFARVSHFFTNRTINMWNSLPDITVTASSGKVSYNGANFIIINFIGVALLIFILSVFRTIVVF